MIRLMVSVLTVIWTEQSTAVTGKKTNNMVMGWKRGLMEPVMRVTMSRAANTVKDASLGLTKALTLVILLRITSKVMVSKLAPKII